MRALLLTTAFLCASTFAAWSLRPRPAAAGDSLTAVEQLAAGNQRFVDGEPIRLRQNLERRSEIAKGQKPFAAIVGCADSRVPPELVFDQGLGDLFVVRCAGNVLGDAALGSLEYAVEHLGCTTIVVLAHERCGAVDAVVKGGKLPGHIAAFVPPIERVVAEAMRRGGDVLDHAVRLNAERIAEDLRTCGPILSEFVHEGKLEVRAARYDLDTGAVEWLDGESANADAGHGQSEH
jgi:carbonic anhydrase